MARDTSNANAGSLADDLIEAETTGQQRMWGDPNERADGMNGQLLAAALAHAAAIHTVAKMKYLKRSVAFEQAKASFYPSDWSPDAFRDYGSDVANLVVAAAYIRNEIKRRIIRGEDTYRTSRSGAYIAAHPKMSADQALGKVPMDSGLAGKSHTGALGSPVVTINEHAHGNEDAA